MDQWKRDLENSGYIHWPLPLRTENSLEAEGAQKAVVRRKSIASAAWTAAGPCRLEEMPGLDGRFIRLTASSPVGARPSGSLEEGDCGNLGQFTARLSVGAEDWREFNRLYFRIRPACEGIRRPHIGLQFINEGEQPIPDAYGREGFHTVNLINGKWNDCFVEMPSLPRDRVTGLVFIASLNGCETEAGLGNRVCFDISVPELQLVETPEPDHGWALKPGEIACCFSGYETRGPKRAVIGSDEACAFVLKDMEGNAVYSGTAAPKPGWPGLCTADFSAFARPGEYRLCALDRETEPFPVGRDIWLPSAWKALNFLFCERCGCPVPGIHLSCHRDILACHGGRAFVFNGGWHDAGDLSQQLIQSAEVTLALLEMYVSLKNRNIAAALRFREEALWGLDYVLKSRFGDGWRATSVGVSMWPQGFIGDADDVRARVSNNAYDNFLCAAVEACAAGCLGEDDPDLSARTLACAEADFRFAMEKFASTGFDERPPAFWEHSWMTPESTFSATIAWSAALLFEHTGKAGYRDCAAEHARRTLACMEEEPLTRAFPQGGFFWRNAEKKVPVHFNHQARDHIYAQMLSTLLRSMPEHPDAAMWMEKARRHADCIKRLFAFSSPYGMIPAGLYHMKEPEDRISFERQHLLTGPEAYGDCARQLEAGQPLGNGWYLRQFPVWFSFRGNNAVILSKAKAAAILGRLLDDEALLDIASLQLQWNIGLNPFRQSLMYGEGRRYASQYAALLGECTGSLPVGVQTRGNEDEPYWPQMNNATYKEVWTTSAARWLAVVSELVSEEDQS